MKFLLPIIGYVIDNNRALSKEILYLIISKELGIPRIHKDVMIENMNSLSDKMKLAFQENHIATVKDAIIAYSLDQELEGIGEKTWERFFNTFC